MFRDRTDAGRRLAPLLERFGDSNPVVVGLPRGGVVVAAEVAAHLHAPLDLLVVRKLGAPQQPELAIGAVVDGGGPSVFLDTGLIQRLGVQERYVEEEVRQQVQEIHRRECAYRGGRPAVPLQGRTVLMIDDGVATGATTRVALRAIRGQEPERLILAVPVGSPETLDALAADADEVIAVERPEDFRAVGQFYERFDQTEDKEVIRLLEAARGQEKGRSVA